MVTDTSVTPEKKLEGVDLMRPDTPGIDPAFRAGMEEGVGAALAERVTALEDELAIVKADRDEQGRRADKAEAALVKAKAKVTREDGPAKPRRLKRMDDGLTGAALTEALIAADEAGKPVEIAFSDGKGEVPGIPPARVEGDVWKPHTLGLVLRDPVRIEGPAAGGSSSSIVGYALLIDGRQVAWCERSEPLTIAPGREMSIQDDIYF